MRQEKRIEAGGSGRSGHTLPFSSRDSRRPDDIKFAPLERVKTDHSPALEICREDVMLRGILELKARDREDNE